MMRKSESEHKVKPVKQDRILVIGSSGTVGRQLVKILKESDVVVREATSGPVTRPNSVRLNLATGEGLSEAFDGVNKAFLLSPPGFSDHFAMLNPLVQEAKKQGLEKVVLMTALGANASDATPFRRVELELEKSGLGYNIIRPNWFFQNFNTFWLKSILEQAKILLPAGMAKTSFIDASDISAVAAKLLTSGAHNSILENRAFDITGPTSLTHEEVALEISKVSGRDVVYESISPAEFKAGLLSAGLPEDYADFMVSIIGFLREGYNSATTSSVEDILGRAPRNLAQYAREHRSAWIA